jgi:hypothetical protein
MAVPWAVACSCGWVAVAETIHEAAALVEAHAEQRKEITSHAITIRGGMDPKKRGRRRRPPSGSAPI